ncbi:hypothetical protein TNCV_2391861 [Trichonephila clavipes]|nr:hypothetical protein TNCV_2391861 [Trichonephila clavipes]
MSGVKITPILYQKVRRLFDRASESVCLITFSESPDKKWKYHRNIRADISDGKHEARSPTGSYLEPSSQESGALTADRKFVKSVGHELMSYSLGCNQSIDRSRKYGL